MKAAGFHGPGGVARLLLPDRLVAMLPMLASLLLFGAGGCLFPPPLEQERPPDGGINRPPALRWDLVQPRLAEQLSEKQSEPGKPPRKTDLQVVFDDLDRQPIAVRLFIDRDYKAFLADDLSLPTTHDTRSVVFTIQGLCDKPVNSELGLHQLEVYISDSGFVDTGTDLRIINPGGFRDNALWVLNCDPAT